MIDYNNGGVSIWLNDKLKDNGFKGAKIAAVM